MELTYLTDANSDSSEKYNNRLLAELKKRGRRIISTTPGHNGEVIILHEPKPNLYIEVLYIPATASKSMMLDKVNSVSNKIREELNGTVIDIEHKEVVNNIHGGVNFIIKYEATKPLSEV